MSFTPQVVTGSSADGEYVYYNATVMNNTVTTDQRNDDPILYFQDTRQNAIIKDTSKYSVSVDNFTVNGPQKNIPLFIPQIQPGITNPDGNPDINVTIYTVSFCWQSEQPGTRRVIATIPLTWSPENLSRYTTVPTTATPRQAETDYYYGYSYDHFVMLFNNALTTAWRNVRYHVQTTLGLTFGTVCPFLEYNPESGLFSLCQDSNTSWVPYGTAARANNQVYKDSRGESDYLEPYGLYGPSADTGYGHKEFSFVGMNANMEGLLTNFDTLYHGFQGVQFAQVTGVTYTQTTSYVEAPTAVTWSAPGVAYYPEFIFNLTPDQLPGTIFALDPPYTPSITPVPLPTYFRDTQNYISTGTLWNPVASIVLVTTQIPVRFESVAAPVEIGDSNFGGTSASTGASQKVLLEVPINALTADMWRGFIDYKPLVPLFSSLDPVHDGLMNLDVKVCWRSRLTNSLIPLRMYNSSSFTIRLRFVRRSG